MGAVKGLVGNVRKRRNKVKMGSLAMGLVIAAVGLSSCSKVGEETKEKPETLEEIESKEEIMPNTGEAIFTYKDSKNMIQDIPELYITLISEPIDVPDLGLLKFKGAVVGKYPVALIEISGRGFPLMLGDNIGGYSVSAIGNGYLKLVARRGP